MNGRALVLVAVVLAAAALAAPLVVPAVVPALRAELDPARLRADEGPVVHGLLRFQTRGVLSCAQHTPANSNVVLREDGRPLGPGQTDLADVRASGRGAYVQRGNTLFFTSSDGTDPRSNGRRYTAECRPAPQRGFGWAVAAGGVVALLLYPAAARRLFARVWPWALLAAAVAARGLAAAREVPPGDAALARAIPLHLVLGAALAAVVFGAGAGILLALRRRRPPDVAEAILLGYPLGLVVTAASAAAAVALPYGRLLGAAAVLAALALLARRFDAEARARLLPALGRALPACLLGGLVFALLWRGPTATLAGAPIGDLTMFVGRAATVEAQLYPLPSLAVEGELQGYGNQLPGMIAAALRPIPGFDPFLFFAGGGTVFLLVALAVCVACARPTRSAGAPLAIAALVAASIPYGSWIVEASAVPFAVPLVFAVYHLHRRSAGAAAAAALVGSALSKVVSAAVLLPGPLLAFAGGALRARRRWQLAAFAVAAALAAGYTAYMLRTYLPHFARVTPLGPEAWQRWHALGVRDPFFLAPHLFRDVGLVALAVLAARLGPAIAASVWIGVVANLVFPHLFLTGAATAVLLAAVAWDDRPERLPPPRALALAVALAAGGALLRDPGGLVAGATWLGCVALVVRGAAAPWTAAPAARRAATVAPAVALVAALGALAAGWPVVDTGLARRFTPELRDIWAAVRERTPRDALVFTDQTGDTSSRTGGWNDYAEVAERQFFLASWAMSPMRFDAEARARRLAQNEAVLSGAIAPDAVPLTRRYAAAYAVVRADRLMPDRFELVYRNGGYALWRIDAAR